VFASASQRTRSVRIFGRAGQPRLIVADVHLHTSETSPSQAIRAASGLRAACASCEVLADLKNAGHGSLFSPWPASLARSLTPLLVDPPGFEREELPGVYRATAAFFARELLPGR
jgi:hypothetical protein